MLQSQLQKPNCKCVICGRKYYVCEDCLKRRHEFVPWRLFCDSNPCNEIYSPLDMYRNGLISKDEAISVIADRIEFYSKFGYDISINYDALAPELKPVYVALYGEPEQVIVAEEPVVEPVVETIVETIDTVVEEVAEEQPVEKENKNEYITSVYGFKHKKKHK